MRSKWLFLKYRLYEFGRRIFPESVQYALGRSALLKPFRDIWLRRGSAPEIMGGEIEFETCRFYFAASYKTFSQAKARGLERRICRLILAYCGQGDVCIDVGANYGFITSIMACSVGQQGSVLAFEPDPQICDVLEKTVSRNDFSNVTIVKAAVGSSNDGELAFDQPGNESVKVPTMTLDTIMVLQQLKQVALVKIDVDGTDYEVLLGARKTLAQFHPLLIVELGANEELIFEFVKDLGYKYIYDMWGSPLEPGNWPPNLIASMYEVEIPPPGFTRKGGKNNFVDVA